jgi:hypothetical protein
MAVNIRVVAIMFVLFVVARTANCAEAVVDDIRVRGSQKFVNQIKAALGLLRTASPDSYAVVRSYIGRIEQSRRSGMAATEDPPTAYFSEPTALGSLTWCASNIAHEAYHSKLYHEYRREHGEPVPDDAWGGQLREQQCCVFQTLVLRDVKAPEDEIRYAQNQNGLHFDVDGDGYYTWRDYLLQDW